MSRARAQDDRAWLRRAARLAVRGHGGAEPNPLVGCVIVSPDGTLVGAGHHRHFGGPHAEVRALHQAGPRAKGATAYVTLEPCAHHGKTPPCADALVAAGVRRVVFGAADPHAAAAGGARRLAAAGVSVELVDDPHCSAVLAPFAHRLRTGLPWVCAKWAQTVDGRIATRTGESRWISSSTSRRLVHRERGRVDAVLTGIGTVHADDPQLTARDVRVRRQARRVVVDAKLQTPSGAALVRSAGVVPTTICCARGMSGTPHGAQLRAEGVEIIELDRGADGHLSLHAVLRTLVERHDTAHVLVEAGAGLTGALLDAGLVNETWVFIAPTLLADSDALSCATGRTAVRLDDGIALDIIGLHRRDRDVLMRALVVG